MVYTGESTSDHFKLPNSDPNFLISYFVQSLHCPYLVIFTLFNCLPNWLRVYYRRWMTLCNSMETLVGICPFVELKSISKQVEYVSEAQIHRTEEQFANFIKLTHPRSAGAA